jgi:hypothetical protein
MYSAQEKEDRYCTHMMTSHFHLFSPTCSSIVNPVHTIIDQTSFRTKGTVVVFGVTKLYIKDYISPASCPPHWLDKGGRVGGRGGVGEAFDHF